LKINFKNTLKNRTKSQFYMNSTRNSLEKIIIFLKPIFSNFEHKNYYSAEHTFRIKKKNLACNKTTVNKNKKIIMVENQALKTNLINKRSGRV